MSISTKDTHALRIEFVRSVFKLPGGDVNDALAAGALLSFIKGTTNRVITPGDEHALSSYLFDAVQWRGQPGIRTDRVILAVAELARRASDGEETLNIPTVQRVREVS